MTTLTSYSINSVTKLLTVEQIEHYACSETDDTLTKCHDGRIAILPVTVLYMFSYERQNMWHNVIFTARCHQHQAHTSSLAWVPLIIIVILLLHGHSSTVTTTTFTIHTVRSFTAEALLSTSHNS